VSDGCVVLALGAIVLTVVFVARRLRFQGLSHVAADSVLMEPVRLRQHERVRRGRSLSARLHVHCAVRAVAMGEQRPLGCWRIRRSRSLQRLSLSGLKELDRVAGRVVEQDL
jgi:hypothetical protein